MSFGTFGAWGPKSHFAHRLQRDVPEKFRPHIHKLLADLHAELEIQKPLIGYFAYDVLSWGMDTVEDGTMIQTWPRPEIQAPIRREREEGMELSLKFLLDEIKRSPPDTFQMPADWKQEIPSFQDLFVEYSYARTLLLRHYEEMIPVQTCYFAVTRVALMNLAGYFQTAHCIWEDWLYDFKVYTPEEIHQFLQYIAFLKEFLSFALQTGKRLTSQLVPISNLWYQRESLPPLPRWSSKDILERGTVQARAQERARREAVAEAKRLREEKKEKGRQ
jgi:hypothetical protein